MKMKLIIVVTAVFLILVLVQGVYALTHTEPSRTLRGVSLDSVQAEEIRFTNSAQDLALGGLLLVPEGEGAFTAVVIIHGSGPSRRDNGWYLTLSRHLQQNGVVVVLPDKRGSVASEGDWRTASFDDLATDTVAAIDYLQTQQRVDVAQIGVIGMSQGGHFVPLVVRQTTDVAFVVNMVGSAVPLRDQLVYEENQNLRQMGVLPGLSNLLAHPAAWSIRAVRQKGFWDAIDGYDPRPDWQALDVPTLVLYGRADTNVDSARSAAILRGLDKPNIDVRVFDGSGHALEDPPGQGDRIIRQEALQAIVDFVETAVGAP